MRRPKRSPHNARPPPRAPEAPAPPLPARVRPPKVPSQTLAPSVGAWLWTCRAGFEPYLYEELAWQSAGPKLLGAALVESARPAREPPAFARTGFRVQAIGRREELPERLRGLGQEGAALHLWAPDTDEGNARANAREALRESLDGSAPAPAGHTQPQELSAEQQPVAKRPNAWEAHERGGNLIDVCEVSADCFALGRTPAREAFSLSPGGKTRMRRGADAPSRAAMKLDEALSNVSLPPGKGDLCVDLGAAPGGWTARLVARGARVIAVDPAKLTPELTRHAKVRHVQESAFDFEPEEPVDWLFCDMAWRPLEVAQLLAKWARRGWALQLCANLKLPMTDKLPVLHRARHLLTAAGWRSLRVRQLYHDRDEVTVLASAPAAGTR